jgi:hypothetical protein
MYMSSHIVACTFDSSLRNSFQLLQILPTKLKLSSKVSTQLRGNETS